MAENTRVVNKRFTKSGEKYVSQFVDFSFLNVENPLQEENVIMDRLIEKKVLK